MRHAAMVPTSVLTLPAHGATTTPIGEPFRTTSRGLREYLLALARRSGDQRFGIEGCALLNGGIEIEVLERGKFVGGMHFDRVRIIGSNVSPTG